MRKILYILLSFIVVSVNAQIDQPRIKFDQVIKDSTGSGRIVISSLTDSNMIYSPDFYINTVDSLLILFGDTVQAGSAVDAAQVRDIIFATIDAGLGVEIDTSSQLGILTIQSLSVEDSVYNGTASTITKGTPLYVDTIQGNYWSVAPAQANDPTKMPVVAIAGENIAAGQQGLGLLKGHIKGVNTELFAAGDEVWVGAIGGYTNVRPKGEDVLVQKLGTVVKANANGSGIINLGEVQYNLNPNNIFIGGADSVQTTVNLPTVLSDSLNNYVTIAGTQAITGAKTFSTDVEIDGKLDLNDGANSVFIGTGVGRLDDGTDNRNVGVGHQILYNNTTGYRNTASGYQALFSNTTGFDNIANGYSSLYSNTTGFRNIANGSETLRSNTTGIRNIANGHATLYSNTTGSNNTASGYQALYSNTSGSNNTASGYEALYSNTTGNNNVANGNEALRLNTIGVNNVANGYRALYNNTTGNNNVANGYQALYSNTIGNQNVANGYQALYSNTTGLRNISSGYQALYNNTTGDDNVANGYRALYNNTTGDDNVANGRQALFSLNSGGNNQAYGFNAGRYLSDGSTALTTANGSLFIGTNTRASADSNSNEIVIGTNAIGNGSNSVTIGNDGTIGTATSKTILNGNVGIGTPIPSQKLDVVGNVEIDGKIALNDGGRSVYVGDNAGRIDDADNNRNVGIGYESLYNNTDGINNVAIGYGVLKENTSGRNNIAIGYTSMFKLSSGDDNFGLGSAAGRYIGNTISEITNANGSIFLGSGTRASADSNSNEIVIGTDAIGNGSNTITIGSSSTQSLHTRNYEFDIDQTVGGATDNYVLTYDSLDGQISLEPATGGIATIPVDTFVTIAGTETITGAKTFTSDVEIDGKLDLNYGGSSVFIGENAGASDNETTNYNVGIGYLASQSVSSGEYNTAIGNSALRHNSTGSGNVAIGSTAGAFLKVGGNNTNSTNSIFIGNASRPDSISQSNQIVIGYFAEGLGTNTAIIGNGDLTDIYNGADNANFSTVSDARDKTSIQSLKLGLNLIEKLNPVAFVWNRRDGKRKGIKDVGFIAQEFDASLYALPHSEYTDFVKITEDGNWKLNLSDIYPVVVKAIQEQQAIIETQATEIDQLKTLITDLTNRIQILENK